jgi:hypothetical protein
MLIARHSLAVTIHVTSVDVRTAKNTVIQGTNMIKVFINGCKMNAVDDKNNLVGFDTSDDCCAHGGWFVSPKKITEDYNGTYDQEESVDYPEYTFDPNFFEGTEANEIQGDDGIIRFRMVAEGKPDLFLHLYNCHNGYYSKGFYYSFGEIKKEGYL